MQHYQRIRDLREDADLTQEALSHRLGMHKTTYTNYEQGKHTVPLDFAVVLADFYQVSLDYLTGRTNFPHGTENPDFSEEQIHIAELYAGLSEKNKGRLEYYLEELLKKQTELQTGRSKTGL
ncbi:MAG: helix-turn-helix transcriptional regulator [Oscillospiraceae bacterium]|nr:helix-turn-helix transcriptional regulator [Oscillospiraceae bacterium]